MPHANFQDRVWRKAACVALLIGAATVLTANGLLPASSAPVASTTTGQVRGTAEDDVLVFKGIRYGADTAPLRFQPASKPAPWKGIADARDFGATCPQIAAGKVSLFASWSNDKPQSEDCLFLNVWTRGLADGKKRPVMVWFHGGGYVTGSGSSEAYDGVRLAKRGDVVLVTVNHRLNAFGYLYLARLNKDPRYAASGNVGSLDMVQSLQWVHDNIAHFGGDPANITIFGESGGAAKVSSMLAMPAAQRLFNKVIAESGSMSVRGFTPAEADAYASDVLQTAGLTPDQVDRLATLPFDQLVAIEARSKSRGVFYRPVADGGVMPRQPFDPDAPAISTDKPLLVGTNDTEMALQLGVADPTVFGIGWDEVPRRAAPFLRGGDAAAMLARMRALHPEYGPTETLFRIATWRTYRKTAITEAERKADRGGAPVYMYRLDWRTPVDGGKWISPHALDIGFVFDNVTKSTSMVGSGTDQQHMADLMSDAWIAFARTGNPQTPALPDWPRYNSKVRPTMIFTGAPRVENDPDASLRAIFAPLPQGRTD